MKQTKEIIKEIKRFESELSKKYNCCVVLQFNVYKIPLEKIINIVNTVFEECEPDSYYNKLIGMNKQITVYGIRNKYRDMNRVLFRAIYYHFAKDAGYSLANIGAEVNTDHATVINGIKKLNEWLSYNEVLAVKYFKKVEELLWEV